MKLPEDSTMAFSHKSKYKFKSVTYEVTAFFSESGEDVREKLLRLMKSDVHHQQSVGIIASSQVGTVK